MRILAKTDIHGGLLWRAREVGELVLIESRRTSSKKTRWLCRAYGPVDVFYRLTADASKLDDAALLVRVAAAMKARQKCNRG